MFSKFAPPRMRPNWKRNLTGLVIVVALIVGFGTWGYGWYQIVQDTKQTQALETNDG